LTTVVGAMLVLVAGAPAVLQYGAGSSVDQVGPPTVYGVGGVSWFRRAAE